MKLWTKKYQPTKLKDVQAHEKAIYDLKDYVVNYKFQKKKAALIYGPTGSGKTCSVYALAKESDLEVVEMNASSFRNKDNINEIIGGSIGQASLFNKGKIILIDEVDGLSGMKDRGGVQALVTLLSKSSFPIILTANDPWQSKLSSLRMKCKMIEFQTLSYISIFNVLRKIATLEKVRVHDDILKKIATSVGGDLRAAISDLQTLSSGKKVIVKEDLEVLGERNKKENIFEALKIILKSKDADVVLGSLDNLDENFDEVFLWLDENLPIEYKNNLDLARGFNYLSKADIFRGRIRRWQHWRFLVYERVFLTVGIALSKDKKYFGFQRYKRTQRILKYWKAKMKYAQRNSIAEKIAMKIHSSSKKVLRDELPYFKIIFKNNGQDIAKELDLDEKEIAWFNK
ncbi:MAG: replication factor C large subunit [Nanoarchaeota archaeon]|nr:replication factor C large subunit [Nanoarchaeota archaeon]MBU1445133.1 replication factor C large subunit [Nanoarchaeota archaeon]MBU2420081.1 replication factor C large subunit [Nanoarchaeota archaeon]MBU2475560.1 replication factor C large subunit [Nanoarchaeota archaeon]